MDGVDAPGIGLPADTVADDEDKDPANRLDGTRDAVSEASSPADPDPDDDWVPA